MYDINVLKKYGIDLEKCIDLFGNIESYDEVLRDFLNTINEKITKTSEYLYNMQINKYTTEVHNLKNDARYLGFDLLATSALEIENYCEKNDIENVKLLHPKFIGILKHYISIIKLYFTEAPSQELDDSINPVKSNTISQEESTEEEKPVIINVINNEEENKVIKIDLNKSNDNIPVVRPKVKKDKLLIADDSSMITKFVGHILSNDYDVVIAKNGNEAIKLLDDSEFRKDLKLCLLDLNMPEVDGYTILEHCKQKGYFDEIPIAVESGVEDTQDLDKINSYPVVGVLLKPFKESDLRRIIEKSNSTYF